MTSFLQPREIARWSARNPWPARLLLIFSHLLLTLLAVKMGGWLFDLQFQLTPFVLWCSVALALFIFLTYPAKKTGYSPFVWRKTCDGLLAVCTFCMILQQSNQSLATGHAPFIQLLGKVAYPSFPASSTYPATGKENKLKLKTRSYFGKMLHWKTQKSFFNKSSSRLFKKERYPTTAEKVLYTVLGILGAVLLFYLVALAACSLSCNGAETAATVVAIVGIGGIVFLLVLLFRHLYKKRPEETAPAV